MNQKRFFTWGAALILVVVAVLVSIQGVLAQAGPAPDPVSLSPLAPKMSSPSYGLFWDVIGNGGGVMTSTSYHLQSTLGQNAIGTSSSASYALHAGYWQFFHYILYLPLIES